MVKKITFKKGTAARRKREKIILALKRKGLPKKLRRGLAPTKKQARFAIATAAVKKQFIDRKFM